MEEGGTSIVRFRRERYEADKRFRVYSVIHGGLHVIQLFLPRLVSKLVHDEDAEYAVEIEMNDVKDISEYPKS